MIPIEKLDDGRILNINHSSARMRGYGHYHVEVELELDGEYRMFSHVTTNMMAIDEAKELGQDSWSEATLAHYRIVENYIEEQVKEWIDGDTNKN